MKRILLSAVVLASVLASCTSNESSEASENSVSIVGTWVGTSVDFVESSNGNHRQQVIDSKNLHQNSVLILNEDRTLAVTNARRSYTADGNYVFDGNQLSVILNMDTTVYIVSELTDSEMIAVQPYRNTISNEVVEGDLFLHYSKSE
ncbi:lipocalin family protein [Phaeocystidibacter marisrubri]|uniref:Uncharacterized protein n=1 Tax=Phaeocystidibacter marisrubri TaxID=1577780 RepID=A0A6L3ZG47_9FLAO|nr:lipocalin family protein [Phaeocystidibacter marisrubri]KAB2816881.1 hypothetical protein F8C82_00345 [Phaeocystidibacter marisrubri]GGH77753.1 hypothetical protein GCM10011318_28000 [Phaeocystidibacter marisrubri]